MQTTTTPDEPTADDRARRFAAAIADMVANIVQLRMMCDSLCRTLKRNGHSSIEVQAMASHTLTCQIQAIEVSSRAKSFTENRSSERPVAVQVPAASLH